MKWTKPKIYKPKKGRWYIYYNYQHPTEVNKLGRPKMVRFKLPSFGLNKKYSNYKDRLEAFKKMKEALITILKRGYSPFEDDFNFESREFSAEKAINYVLSEKRNTVEEITYKDYERKSLVFKEYLRERGYLKTDVRHISRNVCIEFLSEISKRSSNRNRNNYKVALSAIFSILENENYIEKNFFKTIKNEKATPKAHKIYTDEEVQLIFKTLENEPTLMLYAEMVGYGFLRPVEACRIQVKDINLKNATWQYNSKTKKGKIKRIPNILLNKIKKLNLVDKEAYLITNDGVSLSKISPEQRRSTFSKKFRKILDNLKFDKGYDVYSLRHYYTTKVYNQLILEYSHNKALDELQIITGHKSKNGLMNYLRSIDVQLPSDYSDLLK